jgi:hypothetical protein
MDDHTVYSIASADSSQFTVHRESSFRDDGDGIQVSNWFPSGLFMLLLKERAKNFVSNCMCSHNDFT